jgi:hypothetical protein
VTGRDAVGGSEAWGEDPKLVELLGVRGAVEFRALLDGFPEAVGVLWAEPRMRGSRAFDAYIRVCESPSNNADIALRRRSSIGITVTTVNPTPFGNAAASCRGCGRERASTSSPLGRSIS